MKKLIVPSNNLKVALAKVGQAINPKMFLPVLRNIYCRVTPNQLEMIGSNTEITIFYKLECEAKEEFEFLVPFEFLSKIIAITPGIIPIEIEVGKQVKIKGMTDVYEIKTSEKIKDLPKLPEVSKDNSFSILSDVIYNINQAVSTTGKGDTKPQLAHVLMELAPCKITIASSDGAYMVFSKEFEYPDQNQVAELLLSQKVIKVLHGSNKVDVFFNEKFIGFEDGDITIINVRSEEKFVNFRRVFPDQWPGNLTINRMNLVQVLEKCSLSTDQLHTTKIDLESKEEAKFNAEDEMVNINVSISYEYSGTVKQVSINAEKMLRLLNQISADDIQLAIHDSKRAIVITSEDEPGYKGMIMPIATN